MRELRLQAQVQVTRPGTPAGKTGGKESVMPARRWWLVIAFVEFNLLCLVGYKLNGSRPSVPWALAGLAVGALTVAVMVWKSRR